MTAQCDESSVSHAPKRCTRVTGRSRSPPSLGDVNVGHSILRGRPVGLCLDVRYPHADAAAFKRGCCAFVALDHQRDCDRSSLIPAGKREIYRNSVGTISVATNAILRTCSEGASSGPQPCIHTTAPPAPRNTPHDLGQSQKRNPATMGLQGQRNAR